MFGLLQNLRSFASLPLPSATTLILARGRAFLGGRTVIVRTGNLENAFSRLKKITQAEGLVAMWRVTRHTRRGQEKRLQVKDNIRRNMKDTMRQKVTSILANKSGTGEAFFFFRFVSFQWWAHSSLAL